MAIKYLAAEPVAMREVFDGFDSASGRGYVAARTLRFSPGPGTEPMQLKDFFSPEAVTLGLRSGAKDEILAELVGLLRIDDRSSGTLLRILQRRENLGSTGVGRGIAIPHCRSLVVSRLRLAFGRKPGGVEYQAIDSKPVFNFFLIVAPPLEISNQYLPVLGKIAQFAKEPDVPDRLAALKSPEEFFKLLGEKGV
jgi:nitrogen PTS system EIIA component